MRQGWTDFFGRIGRIRLLTGLSFTHVSLNVTTPTNRRGLLFSGESRYVAACVLAMSDVLMQFVQGSFHHRRNKIADIATVHGDILDQR